MYAPDLNEHIQLTQVKREKAARTDRQADKACVDDKLTLISQCEPTHLWKILECLEADHSSEHLKADDRNLVLFDEAWSNCTFLIRLLVNQAYQCLPVTETIILT